MGGVPVKEVNFIPWWRTASRVGFKSAGHWESPLFAGEVAFVKQRSGRCQRMCQPQQSQGRGVSGIGNHKRTSHEAEEGCESSRTYLKSREFKGGKQGRERHKERLEKGMKAWSWKSLQGIEIFDFVPKTTERYSTVLCSEVTQFSFKIISLTGT